MPITNTPPAGAALPSPTPTRRMSLTESIMSARPPLGALAATGEMIGRAPSMAELRRDSAGSVHTRKSRRNSVPPVSPTQQQQQQSPTVHEETEIGMVHTIGTNGIETEKIGGSGSIRSSPTGSDDDEKIPVAGWWPTTITALSRFWKWFITPMGFVLTIYMLNIVAWGGMLTILLFNGSPAMCSASNDCNAIDSPRRIWIEIDSQILNALFCVTGLGLIPWRFRDLFFILQWRLCGNTAGYTRLQEIHANWYRGDDDDGSQTPTPTPTVTVTGTRAPPSGSWKLDYVIWGHCFNTFFQVALAGFMWGMNRIERPVWAGPVFVVGACLASGLAGGQVWWESRKIKRIEGVPRERETALEEGKK